MKEEIEKRANKFIKTVSPDVRFSVRHRLKKVGLLNIVRQWLVRFATQEVERATKLYNKDLIEVKKPDKDYFKGSYEFQLKEYQQSKTAEVIMKELREEVDFWKDNHFDKKIRDLKQEVERLESRIRGELGACSVKMDDGWRSPTDEEMSKIIDGYKKTPTVHEQLNAKEERVKQLEEGIDYINEHYSPHVTGLELKCELLLSKDTKPD